MLREDNLGLGAKIGKGNAETFGLSMFSVLLGRLNGKSDAEVQKQENAQRDVQLASYQAQKFGFMNFVSGGFLVGDKIEQQVHAKNERSEGKAMESSAQYSAASSKKRKAADTEDEAAGKQPKRKKQRSDLRSEAVAIDDTKSSTNSSESKRKKNKRHSTLDSATLETTEHTRSRASLSSERRKLRKEDKQRKKSVPAESADEKSRLRQEKRARKEERRKRKEERRRKDAKTTTRTTGDGPQQVAQQYRSGTPLEAITEEISPLKKNAPVEGGSRHAVRHRYIQQKRMASLNPQAMKEIFMIKAVS